MNDQFSRSEVTQHERPRSACSFQDLSYREISLQDALLLADLTKNGSLSDLAHPAELPGKMSRVVVRHAAYKVQYAH